MSLRSYFRSFFTREYWEAFAGFLFGVAFARRQIRQDFWDRVDREADARREDQS